MLSPPGLTLSLAPVDELNTATGQVAQEQADMHQHLIDEGRRLRSLIRRA